MLGSPTKTNDENTTIYKGSAEEIIANKKAKIMPRANSFSAVTLMQKTVEKKGPTKSCQNTKNMSHINVLKSTLGNLGNDLRKIGSVS